MQRPKLQTYGDEQARRRLAAELPHWTFADGFICRKYRTSGWKGTLMVVNAIGHLAEAAWHHPDLLVSYPSVEVKLQTHEADGITDRDFELAKKIESVVQWQPAAEGGALEGTPNDDERHRYIHYDP